MLDGLWIKKLSKMTADEENIKHWLGKHGCIDLLPPDVPPMPGDSSECMWMLSKHCEMSLIQASLSWAVGATRWIECRVPDLPSTSILKSRLFAFTDSVVKLLLWVEAEQSDSSSSFAASLGSSMSVASIRGIFPTSGSKCNRPAEVLKCDEKKINWAFLKLLKKIFVQLSNFVKTFFLNLLMMSFIKSSYKALMKPYKKVLKVSKKS